MKLRDNCDNGKGLDYLSAATERLEPCFFVVQMLSSSNDGSMVDPIPSTEDKKTKKKFSPGLQWCRGRGPTTTFSCRYVAWVEHYLESIPASFIITIYIVIFHPKDIFMRCDKIAQASKVSFQLLIG